MVNLVIILYSCFFFNQGISQELSTDSDSAFQASFEKGLTFFRSSEFTDSEKVFGKLVVDYPQNAHAWANWGFSLYQIGQTPMAIGAMRRSLFLHPGLPRVQEVLRKAVARENLPQLVPYSFFEKFRERVLLRVTWRQIEMLFLIFVMFSLWMTVRLWGRRKSRLPHIKKVRTMWLGFVALASLVGCLGLLKDFDEKRLRSTVVDERVQVFLAPQIDSVVLFEVPGGVELPIKRSLDGWFLVQLYEGYQGWVHSDSVIVSWGRFP